MGEYEWMMWRVWALSIFWEHALQNIFCRIEVLNNTNSMCFIWALFVRVICTYFLMPYICCQLRNTNCNICMTKDLVEIWTAILKQNTENLSFHICGTLPVLCVCCDPSVCRVFQDSLTAVSFLEVHRIVHK